MNELETFRPWDSGRRVVSGAVLQRTREVVAHYRRQNERLLLDQLAKEFHIHVRTLQAAVQTGRLDAHFSVKSVFGRPRRLATRAAVQAFMGKDYRRYGGQSPVLWKRVEALGGTKLKPSAPSDFVVMSLPVSRLSPW